MLLGYFENTDTKETSVKIFYTYHALNIYTFSPLIETIFLLDTDKPPAGKSYQDKKENLKNIAIDYSLVFGDTNISWLEYAILTDYFRQYGRRYGLLKEFRENAIC